MNMNKGSGSGAVGESRDSGLFKIEMLIFKDQGTFLDESRLFFLS